MRYFLDRQTDKFVPVPAYVDVKTGMLVQRFDGPREGEIPYVPPEAHNEVARQDPA